MNPTAPRDAHQPGHPGRTGSTPVGDDELIELLRHAAIAERGSRVLSAPAAPAVVGVLGRRRLRLAAAAAAGLAVAAGVAFTIGRGPRGGTGQATAPLGSPVQVAASGALGSPTEPGPPQPGPAKLPALASGQDAEGPRPAAMVLAVAEEPDGALACVNWKDLALAPGRSLADLRPEELRSLAGLAHSCGPRTGRVWVVALQGPAGALPRGDQCAADFATCILGTPGARVVDQSGALVPSPCSRGVEMRMETLVVAR
jgi:hypothetical protein